jgi:hypothetical protein
MQIPMIRCCMSGLRISTEHGLQILLSYDRRAYSNSVWDTG